jgi:OmpA-OmpF porin, OOP family
MCDDGEMGLLARWDNPPFRQMIYAPNGAKTVTLDIGPPATPLVRRCDITLPPCAPLPCHGCRGWPADLPEAANAAALPQFANGSAQLTPQAVQILDNLGRALSNQTLVGYRFRIEGHTDTVGSREYNNALSDLRAAAVVDYLANNFGVDRNRVEAIGMGKDGLLIPTPDQTPEPRNRRVQVVNLGSQ